MKTLNGYIEVKVVKNETDTGIVMSGDSPILEVVTAEKGSNVKKGDKIVYKGNKFGFNTGGENFSFINEDDVIAIL